MIFKFENLVWLDFYIFYALRAQPSSSDRTMGGTISRKLANFKNGKLIWLAFLYEKLPRCALGLRLHLVTTMHGYKIVHRDKIKKDSILNSNKLHMHGYTFLNGALLREIKLFEKIKHLLSI